MASRKTVWRLTKYPSGEKSEVTRHVEFMDRFFMRYQMLTSFLQWVMVVTSMMISTFLYALDNTVVVDVQVDIIRSLGQVEKLPWLGTAFAWATMSTILPWSRLFGLYDAKWLYIIAITIFEVGSALCGAAPNMDIMIVGRVIAGLGASGMYIGCLSREYPLASPEERSLTHWRPVISTNTTEQERPTYMGE